MNLLYGLSMMADERLASPVEVELQFVGSMLSHWSCKFFCVCLYQYNTIATIKVYLAPRIHSEPIRFTHINLVSIRFTHSHTNCHWNLRQSKQIVSGKLGLLNVQSALIPGDSHGVALQLFKKLDIWKQIMDRLNKNFRRHVDTNEGWQDCNSLQGFLGS